MACGATLKRSLEFDPLHSPGRSPKRLCMPKDLISPAHVKPQHSQSVTNNASVAAEAAQKLLHSHCMSPLSRLGAPVSPQMQTSKDESMTSAFLSATSVLEAKAQVLKSPTNIVARQCSSLSSQTHVKDQPLFTLTQVDMICRRVVQEHEGQVREQFDKVLYNKLAEQYESFLKFNHDQLKRRFITVTDCSYVS